MKKVTLYLFYYCGDWTLSTHMPVAEDGSNLRRDPSTREIGLSICEGGPRRVFGLTRPDEQTVYRLTLAVGDIETCKYEVKAAFTPFQPVAKPARTRKKPTKE